ncbi:cadmium resistance transporter [Trinickia sp. Y13]|uniref:cadmium resistance transporter n=1 Tax=Trinickia sp. Y13 TaxID=2917807 RepID=UPI0024059F29|nr:cadmium resistance transporter [Trinickia sp. Y13]MDG0022891.1 cadmium resistance transporter [Trinickia sp. Y13]
MERTLDASPALIVPVTAAYVSTNVDGYALLLGFFSNQRYRAVEVVAGQFISVVVQVAISIAVMRSGWMTQSPLVGLVGIVPIFAGVKRIAQLRRRHEPFAGSATYREALRRGAFERMATVAIVASSGAIDNVMVYSSVMVGRAPSEVFLIAGTLAMLTALLCLCSFGMASARSPIPVLQVGARRVAPFMTLAIGVALFVRFDTVPWICSLV